MSNLSKRNDDKPFWGITLDGRPIKTLYKDDMVLPSYPLAVAVAEEWESMLDTIDLRIMHTNTMLAKGFRVFNDEDDYLVNHMK
jgi:chaperone required for assembly of F1-ATPase